MLEPRETKIFTVKNKQQAAKTIEKAAEIIRAGGLVAFPTETVYGLGADATNDKAVADIYHAKNRSFENPVALHLHSVEEIEKYVKKISPRARLLMEKFLPGPLMMIFEKNDKVSDIVTGGLRKVGIRIPRHDLCLEFLQACNTPVAATSANRSGRLACVKTDDIMEELNGKFDALLDVGSTPLGIESTVLDVTSDPPRIIRPGFITMEEIGVTIGIAPIFSHNVIKSSSEEIGQKKQDYGVRTIVIEGEPQPVKQQIEKFLEAKEVKRIGIIVTNETAELLQPGPFLHKVGLKNDPAMTARRIFEALKELEKQQVDLILIEGIPREGIGRTVMIKLGQLAEEVIKLTDQAIENRITLP